MRESTCLSMFCPQEGGRKFECVVMVDVDEWVQGLRSGKLM